jgi:hypothetical protein
MTNYNDGKWHGWNGLSDTCPVHKESLVDVVYAGTICKGVKAGEWVWGDEFVGAFRVVKEYKQPIQCWVNVYPCGVGAYTYYTKEEALGDAISSARQALFREVIE